MMEELDIFGLPIEDYPNYDYGHIDTEREKEIIKLTYGFDNNIPLKQKEIAQLFNFDQSYISKLTKKTLKLIKSELTESDKLK